MINKFGKVMVYVKDPQAVADFFIKKIIYYPIFPSYYLFLKTPIITIIIKNLHVINYFLNHIKKTHLITFRNSFKAAKFPK